MSSFSVSSEAVEQASARLADRAAEFEMRVDALNSFVVSVIDSEWSGAAADSFGGDFVEWNHGAHEVHAALSRIAALLAESSGVYATTESDVTRASSDSSVSVAPASGVVSTEKRGA